VLQSMTGFGRASVARQGIVFEIETRSVNHRYLDVRVKLPRLLASLEAEVRSRIQERFERGKVDLAVVSPEGAAPAPRLEVDLEAARSYLRAAERLREDEEVEGRLDVATLLALPGVARFAEPDVLDETLRRELLAAVDASLEAVSAMRGAEGAALERDLLARAGRVAELADALEARAESVAEAVRARLRKRAEQLARDTGLYDEARLTQEITIAADRMDVTEELVRLRSHVEQLRRTVASGGPGHAVGRRLDFLLQELGREANTVGSKAADAPVAHLVVELKSELGRLREQVQNVE
jgi:uncharacterized protein (TIGR00255 family)